MKCTLHKFFVKFAFVFLAAVESSYSTSSKNSCSGIGSAWNPNTSTCICAANYWGSHCQFGRQRITSPQGFIFESEGPYRSSSKYTFLIDSKSNTRIQIIINKFATECNWDHLYIYDGRSIYAPLIAVFSGVIKDKASSDTSKIVTADSGAAFLYYYSDVHITDSGFNLSYRISQCGRICAGHGVCFEGSKCKCNAGFKNFDCTVKPCCMAEYTLFSGQRTCRQCSDDIEIDARASHAVSISGSKMWVCGGYSFSNKNLNMLSVYNLESKKWQLHSKTHDLKLRYGHSMVFYGNNLFLCGGNFNGNITNEFWKYEISTNSWTPYNLKVIAVTGHASVVVGSAMYIFFGLNKEMQYSDIVQKIDLDYYQWSIVKTVGAIVDGRFGHSATYDPNTNIVFVYGGFQMSKKISSELLLFHVQNSKWTVGASPSVPRMLHSAGIIGRNLLIYGGNANNASKEKNTKNQCHASGLIVYKIDCKKWIFLDQQELFNSKGRYGHSAVVYKKSMFIFGGFDGTFKKDIFEINIGGDCNSYKSKISCLAAPVLIGCVWYESKGICTSDEQLLPRSETTKPICNATEIKCNEFTDCFTCTSSRCLWSKSKCFKPTMTNKMLISDTMNCSNRLTVECSKYSSCSSCNLHPHCVWKNKFCAYESQTAVKPQCFGTLNISSCSQVHNCLSCINNIGCLWCESQKTCLEVSAYIVSFPYGQCLEWVSQTTSKCDAVLCEKQNTCQKCFDLPGCGWCSDGSSTGLGTCIKGSDLGPINNTCPAKEWSFTDCPICQCNGHSKCINNTDICEKCYGNVTGKHCDKCEFGYYGNPENNGTCQTCFCNGHLKSCSQYTGVCSCNMKGAVGDFCERCSQLKSYIGNATNGGLCYLPLQVNYEYSSNLTHFNVAAFTITPDSQSKVLEIKITRSSGGSGYMNLSIYYQSGISDSLTSHHMLGSYTRKIGKDDYKSGETAEVRLIVYGLDSNDHFAFKIKLSHPRAIFNLVYFLIMFLVCFCSLLIILIILWKIKQRYDAHTRNERAKKDRMKRISRPFKSITLLLREKISEYQKILPSQIAIEQFATGHLGVTSVIIELPRQKSAPLGNSGICIGSTLTCMPHRWTHMQQRYNRKRKNRAEVPV